MREIARADVPLRARFESWLSLTHERALLVVRFGRGPAARFSHRRPLDEVILIGESDERMPTIGGTSMGWLMKALRMPSAVACKANRS